MKYEQRNDKRQVDKINKKETRRRKKIKRFTIIKRLWAILPNRGVVFFFDRPNPRNSWRKPINGQPLSPRLTLRWISVRTPDPQRSTPYDFIRNVAR